MSNISYIHCKLLKQIKKYPDGISTEELIKINNGHCGIEFVLSELKADMYLTRLISEEDKISKAFGLEVSEYTGDWILTNKALAYLENDKLEIGLKIFNRLIGFVLGIFATLLAQSLHF